MTTKKSQWKAVYALARAYKDATKTSGIPSTSELLVFFGRQFVVSSPEEDDTEISLLESSSLSRHEAKANRSLSRSLS
jgi:hypothetical protein